MLRKLGDRLGILEVSPGSTPSEAPVKIQTRSVTLSELIMTIEVAKVRSLAESPAELLVPFDDVFKAAGIVPPRGNWSIDRLSEFLDSDSARKMDRREAQQEILRNLAAENVDPADVVRDAISRDQALDAFGESVLQKRQRWVAGKRQEIRTIEEQIHNEERQWEEWRRKKRQREQAMAQAVHYLIDKPVISVDEE